MVSNKDGGGLITAYTVHMYMHILLLDYDNYKHTDSFSQNFVNTHRHCRMCVFMHTHKHTQTHNLTHFIGIYILWSCTHFICIIDTINIDTMVFAFSLQQLASSHNNIDKKNELLKDTGSYDIIGKSRFTFFTCCLCVSPAFQYVQGYWQGKARKRGRGKQKGGWHWGRGRGDDSERKRKMAGRFYILKKKSREEGAGWGDNHEVQCIMLLVMSHGKDKW